VSARRGQAGPSTYDRIYATVRRIPRGRVASYGQVATLAGLPGRARQVGYALAALRSSTAVPWHRVVNATGRISLPPVRGGLSQRLLLEREGVPFTADGRIPLERVGWKPRR
jgi:methylated-DNA-protein-cysteine methyltransferase related protein